MFNNPLMPNNPRFRDNPTMFHRGHLCGSVLWALAADESGKPRDLS
jgi:hypothetical protein